MVLFLIPLLSLFANNVFKTSHSIDLCNLLGSVHAIVLIRLATFLLSSLLPAYSKAASSRPLKRKVELSSKFKTHKPKLGLTKENFLLKSTVSWSRSSNGLPS